MNTIWKPNAHPKNYPLNNCLATVKSKVLRETDRHYRWNSEEKIDDLMYSRLSPRSSPYSYQQSHFSPGVSPHVSPTSTIPSAEPSMTVALQSRLKALKQHLREIYDTFGGDEPNWSDRVVIRSVSGIMKAISEVYVQLKNPREALEYLRASWELKKTCSYSNFSNSQVMRNLFKIAEIHELLEEPKMARLAYSEALPLVLTVFGPDHEQTARVYRQMLACTWEQHPQWKLPYRCV